MGKFDSSLTRVVPVFDALMEADPSGRSWLPDLLRLGSLSGGKTDSLNPGLLIAKHPRWWGKDERRLNPPKSLLRWLIENLQKPAPGRYWGSEETRRKRELLVERDPETRAEALNLLESHLKPSAWYVLEGQSQPDAYLVADNLILVIEGKRTERESTTTTTWMPKRSQIIRHLDAAWEIRGKKKVFGMMIVEGDGGKEAVDPSEFWEKEAEAQIKPEMIQASLPHRNQSERKEIVEGFLGVTTWQRVCSEFHLPWPPDKGIP